MVVSESVQLSCLVWFWLLSWICLPVCDKLVLKKCWNRPDSCSFFTKLLLSLASVSIIWLSICPWICSQGHLTITSCSAALDSSACGADWSTSACGSGDCFSEVWWSRCHRGFGNRPSSSQRFLNSQKSTWNLTDVSGMWLCDWANSGFLRNSQSVSERWNHQSFESNRCLCER